MPRSSRTCFILLAAGLPALPPADAPATLPDIPELPWEQRSDWVSAAKDVKPSAAGDGIADDPSALQAALDTVRDGATVYLPPGTDVISTLLSVTGADYAFGGTGFRTCLVWKGPEGGVLVDVRDAKDVTLEQVNIGSHDAGAMYNGVDVQVTASGPSLLHLDGVYVYGMYQKHPDKKGVLCKDLPQGAVVHALHVQGNLRFMDSARARVLIGTSYEGAVTVEGKTKDRDGLRAIGRLDLELNHANK